MPIASFVRLAAWLALVPGQGTYPSEFYISWCYGSECMNQTINAAHMQLQFESHYHHGARPPLKEVFMVVGAPQEMQQELLMSCPGVSILSYMLVAETRLHTHGVNEADRLRLTASNMVGMVGWATNKRFEISKSSNKKRKNSRELKLTNLVGLVLGCIEAKFCK